MKLRFLRLKSGRKIHAVLMTELILIIGTLQVLVPLLLLFWQWREPSTSKAQWMVITTLAIAYLIAIGVGGLWS